MFEMNMTMVLAMYAALFASWKWLNDNSQHNT